MQQAGSWVREAPCGSGLAEDFGGQLTRNLGVLGLAKLWVRGSGATIDF